MTEREIEQIIAEGKCPAEYAREFGYNVLVDCEQSGYDCHSCLADIIERDRNRQ